MTTQEATANKMEAVLKLAEQEGIIRPRDVEALGIPREYLLRLYRRGALERIGRGLYAIPGALGSAQGSLAEVAKRAPNSVVCLLSALHFHDIGTQLPYQVWIAIEGTSWKPQIDYPPVRVFRFSGQAYSYGIEVHTIDNVPVKIYSIAKTVADCFKFRYQIGLDVALEALKEILRYNRASIDEIWQAAKVCRVANVMRPYLEAI